MKKLIFALLLPVAVYAQNYTVAVIPKGASNYWKIYEAGAKKAAADLKVEIVVRGTRFESDIDAQVQIVDYFREKKVNAIVITPLHKDTLVASVEKAVTEGIIVVVTDSGLNSTKAVSFIGSRNEQAGRLSASTLAKILGPASSGEVVLVRYLKGSDSTEKREEGALKELKVGLPKATIIDSYYGGAVLGDVKRVCDTILDEHPNTTGLLTISSISTTGLLKSLQAKNLAGKIPFIGSGSTDEALAALRKGEINGLVLQNPYEMGYRGVQTALAALKGDKVEKEVFTDVVLVTASNVDTPEIQRLMNP